MVAGERAQGEDGERKSMLLHTWCDGRAQYRVREGMDKLRGRRWCSGTCGGGCKTLVVHHPVCQII